MRVRWRLTKAGHAAISFEVVEWSEQLRSVTSAWLGAVRRSFQVRLCTSGCTFEKTFGIISSPRDLLLSIIIIILIMLERHHSGRYVDLKHSLTPEKVSSVFTGKRRFGLVLRPSSTNGYPARFVNETKHRLQKSQRNPRLARTDTVEAVASIPYVQGVSQAIGQILASLNIKTVRTTKQRKWSIMKGVKDAFPKIRQQGVVSALGCKDCSTVCTGFRKSQERLNNGRRNTATT